MKALLPQSFGELGADCNSAHSKPPLGDSWRCLGFWACNDRFLRKTDYFTEACGHRMRHIISILLQNEAGALTRVTSLFSSRGYNIESLSVAPTDDPELSRLTLVTFGSDEVINQINKQLFKLIDVVNIADMTKGDHIEREQLLLKVRLVKAQSALLDEIIAEFNADVIDPNPENFTLVVTGTVSRIDEFVERTGKAAELLTVVRSGAMAIARGEQILSAAI